jgi:SAM-dependent methyltransferase
MRYVHSLPLLPSFVSKGLFGYTFGPLQERDLEVYCIESETGHDTFTSSRLATRLYYVIEGSGYFTISDRRYDVRTGELVELPPDVEYSYSGRMKLIVVSKPRYLAGNDRFTKWNPDVVQGALSPPRTLGSWELLCKRVIDRYLRVNRRLWRRLPASISSLAPVHAYGELLSALARKYGFRAHDFSTSFFRNRFQLELIGRLVRGRPKAGTLKVAVLGCSTGPEAYSIAYAIRSARPDLQLVLHAVDTSRRVIELAQRGRYSLDGAQLPYADILQMNEAEMTNLFERDGDVVAVKSWVREGIEWHVGDVAEPEIVNAIGQHDIVLANNLLCYTDASSAERCLRNIAQLARPNGYIFVSGVDLDVRAKVADDLAWLPLQELLEEIHEGDRSMRALWPCHYAGLEPLNKGPDWERRYAAVFQVPGEQVDLLSGEEHTGMARHARADHSSVEGV